MNILIQPNVKSDAEFTDVYRKYWKYVFSIVMKNVTCSDTAEDICQDVFLAYLVNMHSITNVKSWLSKVATIKTIKNHIKEARTVELKSTCDIQSKCENNSNEIKVMLEDAYETIGIDEESRAILHNKILNNTYITDIARESGLTRRKIAYKFNKCKEEIFHYFSSIGIKSVYDF